MATGNLELTFSGKRLYAFTEEGGSKVLRALRHLEHNDGNHERWFEKTAAALGLTIGDRLTHPDYRVTIDPEQRIVVYNRPRNIGRISTDNLESKGYLVEDISYNLLTRFLRPLPGDWTFLYERTSEPHP